MKKTLMIFLLCSFLISVAFAENTIVVSDTVKPDIQATFNDTVLLKAYNLTYVVTGDNLILDNSTSDNISFMFKPTTSLDNGFYYFIVSAEDKIGNPKEFRENVIVNVNETSIFFVNPRLGISTKPVYDIILGTSRNANCTWSTQDVDFNQGTSTTGISTLSHTISNFGPSRDIDLAEETTSVYVPFWVKCQDTLNRIVSQKLLTAYDSTKPNIERITISQNPVTRIPPATTITAYVDDKSVCHISGSGLNNQLFSGQDRDDITTYSFTPSYTINYAPADSSINGAKTYTVFCENRADVPSDTQTITVNVNIAPALTINPISPKRFVAANPVSFQVETNKVADCDLTLQGTLIPLTSSQGGYLHTYSTTLSQNKSYTYTYTCRDVIGGGFPVSQNYVLDFDLTKPINTTVEANACKSDTVTLSLASNDHESGILGFNYSMSGPGVSVPWTFAGGPSPATVQVTNLNLSTTGTYSVQTVSLNGAGAVSDLKTAAFTFNPNATICLEKTPPRITIKLNDTQFGGKKVTLICTDDESGCLPGSIKYGLSSTSNCTATTIGNETVLLKPQYLCWEAQDKALNKANGTQFIQFTAVKGSQFLLPLGSVCTSDSDCSDNYCFNKICTKPLCTDSVKNGFESDVDCGGGSCNSCDIGKKCNEDKDCSTNSCDSSTKICQITSCTDSIKNGFETDVDCGGKDCSSCIVGKSCTANSDCSSNSCQFGSCVKGEQTFEEWAKSNNIDPTNKDGDADKDGLSNYQEFLHKTDPNKADTDGDGYSDGEEVAAGTDPLNNLSFPETSLYKITLLIISLILILVGVLFMFYFKIDQTTSLNIIVIGGVALLFAIIDWLLFKLPNAVLISLGLIALLSSGYIVYGKRTTIVPKLTGKPSRVQTTARSQQQGTFSAQQENRPEVRKEDIEATRSMIEMIKKQREERENKREELFKKFGSSDKTEKKKESLIPLKTTKNIEKSLPYIPERKEESIFDRLGRAFGGKTIERLEKLGKGDMGDLEKLGQRGQRNKSIEKLGRLKESKIKSLSELEKKASESKRKK